MRIFGEFLIFLIIIIIMTMTMIMIMIKIIITIQFITWLVFVGNITRALNGQLPLNSRAFFSLSVHGPIMGLQKQSKT